MSLSLELLVSLLKVTRVFRRIFASEKEENKSVFPMKLKLTDKQIQEVVDDPIKAREAGVKANDPWWIIALKVIAYLIGLILAGAATASCANAMGII